ncbi:hypothetical protein Rs2_38640 [Raphanus sativus]|nr:hypothetical protein Rs2_38640 [Raphanus sativus]
MISAPPPDSSGTDPTSKDDPTLKDGSLQGKEVTEILEEGYSRERAGEILAANEGTAIITESEPKTPEKAVTESVAEEVIEVIEEIEEGEVVSGWSDVDPGKASKSPRTLKYGQVKIAARFAALTQVDDNGDLVEQEEEEEHGDKEADNSDETTEKDGDKEAATDEKEAEISEENMPITPGKDHVQNGKEDSSITEQKEEEETGHPRGSWKGKN